MENEMDDNDFTLTREQKREAAEAALGVDTPEEMVNLTLDTMIVMVTQIKALQMAGKEEEALRWADQFEKALAVLPAGMKDALLGSAVVRLVLTGSRDVLHNSPATIHRAVQGAKNLHDFGII